MHKLFRIHNWNLQRLHVFTDDVTWMVAFDPEDAKKAYEEFTGDTWDDSYEPINQRLKDTAIFKISCEEDDLEEMTQNHRPLFSMVGKGKNRPYLAAPVWAWILQNGRGFLCSTEW